MSQPEIDHSSFMNRRIPRREFLSLTGKLGAVAGGIGTLDGIERIERGITDENPATTIVGGAETIGAAAVAVTGGLVWILNRGPLEDVREDPISQDSSSPKESHQPDPMS